MSFVPAPQASGANAASSAKNAPVNTSSASAAAEETTDYELVFKIRTFDVYWVEKSALMYRDGFDKVSLFILAFPWRFSASERDSVAHDEAMVTNPILSCFASCL